MSSKEMERSGNESKVHVVPMEVSSSAGPDAEGFPGGAVEVGDDCSGLALDLYIQHF